MPKFTLCSECNRERIAKAFKHDKIICNDCYTENMKLRWEIKGDKWVRECVDCGHSGNTFTMFHKHSNNIVYSFVCLDCQSEREYESSMRNYINVETQLDGGRQRNFVKRFNEMWDNL
jgi:hypothetical protein